MQLLKDLPQVAKPLGRLALLFNSTDPLKLGCAHVEARDKEILNVGSEIASGSVAYSEFLTFIEANAAMALSAQILQADS